MKSQTISTIHRFLLLPSHILIILLLEFLNSFRSYGLRFVLYNYITNEFVSSDGSSNNNNISDTQAGALLGAKSLLDIGFGLSGSILVDYIGVRRVSLVALSVALLSRAILALSRTTILLYVALFVSSFGDALLSIGLYRVALKKLSTPKTRPLCFGLSYACSNMAGICVAVVVDWMRKSLDDVHIDIHVSASVNSMIGGVYTPVRQFIILTWLVLFITFIIAYFLLEDWTVLDLEDLDEEYCNDGTKRIPADILPAEPMIRYDILQQYFTYEAPSTDDETSMLNISTEGTKESYKLPDYKVFRTQYAMSNENEEGTETHPFKGVVHAVKQFITIIQLSDTWRVIVFSFASVPVVLQWTASDMVLPAFLERQFGEQIPIYTIQSIHMLGCIVLPPFTQAFTSQIEDFRVIIPGLFLMGISPIFVGILPNVTGACLWQLCMTFGQVFWSPRQDSWTAGLAPVGMEGLFFAIGSSRALLAPLGDWIMGAMNSKYNPNCITCRDSVGHFCGSPMASSDTDNQNELVECWSVQESCDIYVDSSLNCPQTCNDCPGWEITNPSTVWYILLLISITSPLLGESIVCTLLNI